MERIIKKLLREYLSEKIVTKDKPSYCCFIAEKYENLKDYNSSVVKHWEVLNKSNYDWFKKIKNEVELIFVTKDQPPNDYITVDGTKFPYKHLDGGDPYKTQKEMKDDYQKNNRLLISTDYSDHPVFKLEDNILFRFVHDYLIHIKGNYPFEYGEINAYNLHAKLAPKEAIPAIFTEVVGQACYYNCKGGFPKQKIDIIKGVDYINIGLDDKGQKI